MTNTQAINHVVGLIYARVYDGLSSAEKETTSEAVKQALALLATTLTGDEAAAATGLSNTADSAALALSNYDDSVDALKAAFPDPFAP